MNHLIRSALLAGGVSAAVASGAWAAPATDASTAGTAPQRKTRRVGQAASTGKGVSQEQFRKTIDLLKKVIQRSNQQQKELNELKANGGGSAPAPGPGGAIDLKSLGTSSGSATARGPHGAPGSSGATPVFKIYFDFDLVRQPGLRDLTFKSIHQLMFFEIAPTPDLTFSFDVVGFKSPNYYELDYQISRKLQLRIGKIWIPFDDLSPHNLFGGRVNVSALATPNARTGVFLPDIWADLGIGLKYQLIDTRQLTMEAHAYVVNGFNAGNTDPIALATAYPNFAGTTVTADDNNADKSFGGRLSAKFFNRLSAGVSYFTGAWTDKGADEDQKRVNIFGLDSQIRLGGTEFRTGIATMNVGLPGVPDTSPGLDTFKRSGFYAELGQRFGAKQDWKILGRGGSIQLDDRVVEDVTDQTNVGGTLVYKPGLIEFSFTYARDLKYVAAKPTYHYMVFRTIIAL